MKHYIAMWTGILDFGGTTSWFGYWVPMLFNYVVGGLVMWLVPDFFRIYSLLLTIATFTLCCRRLRDAGFPWLLAVLSFAGQLSLPFADVLGLIPTVLCLFPGKK